MKIVESEFLEYGECVVKVSVGTPRPGCDPNTPGSIHPRKWEVIVKAQVLEYLGGTIF